MPAAFVAFVRIKLAAEKNARRKYTSPKFKVD